VVVVASTFSGGGWSFLLLFLTHSFPSLHGIRSNNSHGWGGNYFMTGGSVKGKRIVGQYPDSLLDSSPLNIGRGRLIPTTPWESPFNAIAEWMGVVDDDDSGVNKLDYVLPNRKSFPNVMGKDDFFV
jgi:uncharacterized protein (DUF1501 family)